ncbi:hypothetical protein IF1G_10677 [Cordyceps javanica]|uniref:LITAF domain-containing protein n=1 Tax=Cordyceps javanica TaxID=43265 RepID=A0A545UMN1_9HYPO|nr:hypothetical protein IF1G_10677 [Cordyceps javanica]
METTTQEMPTQGTTSRQPVPLDLMRPYRQTIECPHCGNTAQTIIEGRGDGMKLFMNIFFWPLPGRRDWWGTTRWRCGNCEAPLASQKYGKDIQVVKW